MIKYNLEEIFAPLEDKTVLSFIDRRVKECSHLEEARRRQIVWVARNNSAVSLDLWRKHYL